MTSLFCVLPTGMGFSSVQGTVLYDSPGFSRILCAVSSFSLGRYTDRNWGIFRENRLIAGLYLLIPISPICFHELPDSVHALTFYLSATVSQFS